MRITKYLLLTVLLANTFFACENVDFGNINKNRNGAEDPATSGLLSGAIMNYATFTNRSGVTIPTLYVQYQAQVTYTDEMLYAETQYSWSPYYTGSLQGLNEIIEITSDPANHTAELVLQGHPANQLGVAKIMRAVIMKRVTDTYGEVPFSEAFLGLDDITPAYDKQEDIYKKLIEEIKEGRDLIDENETPPAGDILYSGDLGNWKKLANSLILQMALQLSKKFPGPTDYAATEFNEALTDPAGVIDEIEEEAWFKYADLVGFRNPWFDNRTADYFLSQEFTDALQGFPNGATIIKDVVSSETGEQETTASLNPTSNTTYDDRSLVYMRFGEINDSRSSGVAYGFRDGSGAGRAQMNRDYYWNATSSLPLITASYTYLNRAEAAALNWTSETALTMLQEGIEKSFETLENHTAENLIPLDLDESYALARVADAGTAPGGILQVIGEEKWVSLFGQAFDAWAEWRRTNYPDLIPATDNLNDGQIPRRFLYPREEPSLNGANYQSAVGRLMPGEDHNTARVWWDQ